MRSFILSFLMRSSSAISSVSSSESESESSELSSSGSSASTFDELNASNLKKKKFNV